MPELLEALDDIGWHAILELIEASLMQARRHIVASCTSQPSRACWSAHAPARPADIAAHHAERHHRRPALVTSDGMMVCSGRLPGAMQLG